MPPPAGAVLYRIPLTWGHNKLPWKLAHAAVMLLAFVLSVVGICAVFDFHNVNHIPNMYSLHSWIGITATALFTAQVRNFTNRIWITSQSIVSFLSIDDWWFCVPCVCDRPSSGCLVWLASSCPAPRLHYVNSWNQYMCGLEAWYWCSASSPASPESTRSSSSLCEYHIFCYCFIFWGNIPVLVDLVTPVVTFSWRSQAINGPFISHSVSYRNLILN